MLKKIISKLLTGGAIAAVGYSLAVWSNGSLSRHSGEMEVSGMLVGHAGLAYGVIAALMAMWPLLDVAAKKVAEANASRERSRAQDELLKYKLLLDQGILSQEEYSKKSEELKRQIL